MSIWFQTLILIAAAEVILALYYSWHTAHSRMSQAGIDSSVTHKIFGSKAASVVTIISNPTLSQKEIEKKLMDLHMTGLDVYGLGPGAKMTHNNKRHN